MPLSDISDLPLFRRLLSPEVAQSAGDATYHPLCTFFLADRRLAGETGQAAVSQEVITPPEERNGAPTGAPGGREDEQEVHAEGTHGGLRPSPRRQCFLPSLGL